MGSTTRPLGVTHQFELHFVVTLLEGEDKEYEHRHVQHEGNESVVTVQEQEEVLGERGRRKRVEWDRWAGGKREGRQTYGMARCNSLTVHHTHTHQVSPQLSDNSQSWQSSLEST